MRSTSFPLFLILPLLALSSSIGAAQGQERRQVSWWEFQSIDTMKYSRDIAREKLKDRSFDKVIDEQVKKIAEAGATHVAVATPYDDEFMPYLTRWVQAARNYNLKVWFRGNFSGWEGWFDYDPITRGEHMEKAERFILSNKNLFENGDVFSACPECENGGPGDPRINGDAEGHKKFLVDEYKTTKNAFKKIGKDVRSNFASMNYDVALLVMDERTTFSMDGVVAIDHYVETPEKLLYDVRMLSKRSGGKIVLGEFGAPIPDIHGNFNEEEQAKWISNSLALLSKEESLIGVSYWVNVGGSTHLWNGDLSERKAVSALSRYFKPRVIEVGAENELSEIVDKLKVDGFEGKVLGEEDGRLVLAMMGDGRVFDVMAQGYKPQTVLIEGGKDTYELVLKKENENLVFRVRRFLHNLFKKSKSNS